jgi:hypothetical protein
MIEFTKCLIERGLDANKLHLKQNISRYEGKKMRDGSNFELLAKEIEIVGNA